MVRGNQSKLSKKEQMRLSKKEEQNKRKKRNEESDDSGFESSDSDNEEMDVHEYRKFLSKIFPSKHISKKVKAGEKFKKTVVNSSDDESEDIKPRRKSKNKKIVDSDSDESEEEDSEEERVCKKSKKSKKSKKILVSDDDDDSDDEDYEEEEDSHDEDDDDDESNNNLNIIFTIGGVDDEDEDDDEFDEDYEDYEDSDDNTEDEDEEVSTDESSSDEDDEDDNDEDEETDKKKKSKSKYNSKKQLNKKTKDNTKKNDKNKKDSVKKGKKEDTHTQEDNKDILKKDTDNTDKDVVDTSNNELLLQLKELLSKNPKDKSIQKCIETYEKENKKDKAKKMKKEKKQKDKNLRIFRKIIRDKNTMNDFAFYEKLELDNQKKLIKELREINKITRIEKPYRMTLLESDIPIEFKAAAMKKINSLKYMDAGSGDFYKMKNWVDTFMHIPFTKNEGLPISIEDGVEKCHDFMENAQKTLDQAIYGLNDAKMQIMQMLGQLLTNPKAIGTAIAIHGPPGTGKTSLVKEGISKILNRPFAFIALGGATDSSFLEGHGYTYEGSTWGKIVQILIDSKCMNPVIYFDELDKISDTPRGEEIAGILTHLTDTSQNSQFHDKYFAEINFDLSKCLFIFSYNDESKVNPILKDRMYRIKTKGYNGKEKTVISNNYLLPKIREQVKFSESDIIIPDDVINHIIETHCNKEDGVRNLKRCLEIIYTKLNLYRLMKPGSNLFEGEMSLTVEFPFKVTKEIVDKLIKKETENTSALWSMYM